MRTIATSRFQRNHERSASVHAARSRSHLKAMVRQRTCSPPTMPPKSARATQDDSAATAEQWG